MRAVIKATIGVYGGETQLNAIGYEKGQTVADVFFAARRIFSESTLNVMIQHTHDGKEVILWVDTGRFGQR